MRSARALGAVALLVLLCTGAAVKGGAKAKGAKAKPMERGEQHFRKATLLQSQVRERGGEPSS